MNRSTYALAAALAVAILAASPAHSQVTPPGLIGGGVRGGLAVGQLSGDAVDDLDPRVGFSGGAYVVVRPSLFYGVQLEALYTQTGAELPTDGRAPVGDPATQPVVRLDYVEFPVLLRANLPVGRAQPYVVLGASVGVNVLAELDSDDDLGLDDDAVEIDDLVNDTVVNGVVGLGVDLVAGRRGAVVLDARYSFGFTDAFDGEALGLGDDPEARPGTFTVSLGFGL